MIDFAGHFHVHDEYSPLDGCGNRNQISFAAAQAEQTHLGFTNHGRLGGALEHVHACRFPEKYEHPLDPSQMRSGHERLIPILGMEAFFRRDRFMDLTDVKKFGKVGHNWAHHLCIHAGSLDGWRTLMRLSSKSWVKRDQGGGHHGKACVDFDMLEHDHEDIIISTACLASPLSWFILNGDDKGAKRFVRRMEKVSKNGIVWFELMPHDLDDQRELNIGKVNLANEMGHPTMATGDVHIPFANWQQAHTVTRMASYKQTYKHREAKLEAGEDVYTADIDTVFLSSGDEMFEQFQQNHPDLPEDVVLEAMANTAEFARQVRWYTIGKTTKAPTVEVDAEEEVRKWMAEGREKKIEEYPESHWNDYSLAIYDKRREYEFQVLKEKNVLGYFYIVGDFVRWAKSTKGLPKVKNGKVVRNQRGRIVYEGKKRPIRVGLGRGSAAGSLVSHDIGITAIDPIPHKLLFERFLNPDREGYPDIDMDFETELPVLEVDGKWLDGRECVKEYLKRMYGHDHVVDIIAYQTFAPRACISNIGAVFDLDHNYLSKITDSIGDTDRGLERIASGNPDKGIDPNPVVAELKENHPDVWKILLIKEDEILRDTRHAGGVVITPKPTNFYIPTQIAADEQTTVTAWSDRADFPIMSDYGFLKYDILGVKALAKQELACQLIRDHYDEEFEPNELPALRDPLAVDQEVIDHFVHGTSWGVFQFQGQGITKLLRHIKPDNATDISVANAMFRPGPMSMAFQYGDRKNGKEPISYWHDSLEPILGETLGLMCFQEQAMQVAQAIGNFSGGEADALRKAMSKLYRLPGDKAQEYMQGYHEQWMKGTAENGISEGDAESIWTDKYLPLGNYLFNRSHSSSYGLQAYQDMHIKVFYPLAFYAATLTIHKKAKRDEQREWMRVGLREARIFEIEAAPPDVNRSEQGWSIDGRKLRYGLVSVRDMGGSLAQQVMDNRPYDDYHDFVSKMDSGFGADKLAALAKGGAFDTIEERPYLLSRTRQWDEGIAKLKVKMTCGHPKTKTIKLSSKAVKDWLRKKNYHKRHHSEQLELAVKHWIDYECECVTHPDAEIEEVKRLDDLYEVARYVKDYPDDEPTIVETPSDQEIEELEMHALNISLAQGAKMLHYKPFIDKRIYSEIEVAELPPKPKMKGRGRQTKHGTYCSCKKCEASLCVVGGEVVNSKVITDRNENKMAFIDLAYGTSHYSCTLFASAYKQYHELLERQTAFLIQGHRDGRGQILVNEVADVVDVAKDEGWDPDKVVSIGKHKANPKLKKKLKRKAA